MSTKTKLKTEWNLKLLYASGTDPKIEQDILAYEKACADFEKKFKGNTEYLSDESALLYALQEYETLFAMVEGRKPVDYFYYRKCLNSTDQEAESKLNQISERLTKAGNKVIFFELTLGKIDKKQQETILRDKLFSHYKYFLEKLFRNAQYDLSEPEEKIMNLKSMPAHGMWVQGQQKLLNVQTVKFQGKQMPLPEAYNKFPELPTAQRRKLADDASTILKNISDFAESELNAVFTDKKINDELRGLEQPYSATIIGYQNDEKSIITFVETVTKHFDISHKFYKAKAKLLGLKKLEYADRATPIGKLKIKLTFKDSLELLRSAFEKVDPKYRTILDTYMENGQIDVFPKKGKKGGAFCSGDLGMPTYVLLNHADNLGSYKTFAHEMGHAIHTELSKSQPPIYERYTISVAEVASTLFENFAFDEVFPKLSEKEKIIALHDRINDSISTVFRQIGCFNYELALHQAVRSKGAISKEEIAKLHNVHMKAYLGPLFNLKELDGYMFVQWPHIRYFFYVYSYAYGELISKALYAKFKENPEYIKEIEKFLSAGGSKSPEQIFKDIGIDTSKPEFFIAGLKSIEGDIKELEKLTSKK